MAGVADARKGDTNSPHVERRSVQSSGNKISSRWLRPYDPHGVRIPRLYFSRLRDMLPRSEYTTSANQAPHGGLVRQYVEEEECPTVPRIQLR